MGYDVGVLPKAFPEAGRVFYTPAPKLIIAFKFQFVHTGQPLHVVGEPGLLQQDFARLP